jgi:hypothetical protein
MRAEGGEQVTERRRAAKKGGNAEWFPCFLCSQPMVLVMTDPRTETYGGWCAGCEVIEEREPFTSRVRTVPEETWFGMEIRYIDHSVENHPSPA